MCYGNDRSRALRPRITQRGKKENHNTHSTHIFVLQLCILFIILNNKGRSSIDDVDEGDDDDDDDSAVRCCCPHRRLFIRNCTDIGHCLQVVNIENERKQGFSIHFDKWVSERLFVQRLFIYCCCSMSVRRKSRLSIYLPVEWSWTKGLYEMYAQEICLEWYSLVKWARAASECECALNLVRQNLSVYVGCGCRCSAHISHWFALLTHEPDKCHIK